MRLDSIKLYRLLAGGPKEFLLPSNRVTWPCLTALESQVWKWQVYLLFRQGRR